MAFQPGHALAQTQEKDTRPDCDLRGTSGIWSIEAGVVGGRGYKEDRSNHFIASKISINNRGNNSLTIKTTGRTRELEIEMPWPVDNSELSAGLQKYKASGKSTYFYVFLYSDGKNIAKLQLLFEVDGTVFDNGLDVRMDDNGFDLSVRFGAVNKYVREIIGISNALKTSNKLEVVGFFYDPEFFGEKGMRLATLSFDFTGYNQALSEEQAMRQRVERLHSDRQCKVFSKIVCTAMNDLYGFGSFRNSVWLRYSKDHLTAHHETGYHVICLPIVRFAYGGHSRPRMAVRRAAEHVARCRTADIWAEMRNGKRHTLGRAYRAVLEPLFYGTGRLVDCIGRRAAGTPPRLRP